MRKTSIEKVNLFPEASQLVMMELEQITNTNIYQEWQVPCLGTHMRYPAPSIIRWTLLPSISALIPMGKLKLEQLSKLPKVTS